MNLPSLALFPFWLLAFIGLSAARERIDPAGISGSLVISGENVSDEAIDQFYRLAQAQGEAARVVILRLDDAEGSGGATGRLRAKWETGGAGALDVVGVGDDADLAPAIAVLKAATGAWVVGGAGDLLRVSLGGQGIGGALAALVGRGGVVGGDARAAALFGEGGINLLPGSIIDVGSDPGAAGDHVSAALRDRPSLVAYEIGMGAALVVRGRGVRAVGRGQVRIHLAASENREATSIVLGEPAAMADLTALRLAAIARQAEPFPAAEPAPPQLDKGTLIIIGGGGMPKGIIARFVELAGGAEASIVVLPTAMPDPVPEQGGIADSFRDAGARQVTVLPGRKLEEVESGKYLDALGSATGIWFGGGRQWRFADAYLDTRALAVMHGVLARGGVIMGSSAGASIQAEYLARANPLGNLDIIAEGYERGLGFIKGVAVDQHFAQRRRFKDMSSLVDRYPQLLGIGIDEGTALIVEGRAGQISGAGRVHFYDRNKPVREGGIDYESVGDGGSYDLVDRRVLDPGKTLESGVANDGEARGGGAAAE